MPATATVREWLAAYTVVTGARSKPGADEVDTGDAPEAASIFHKRHARHARYQLDVTKSASAVDMADPAAPQRGIVNRDSPMFMIAPITITCAMRWSP